MALRGGTTYYEAPGKTSRDLPGDAIFAVGEVVGDFIALDNLSAKAGAAHCGNHMPGLEDVKFRIYVKKVALAEVLLASWRKDYADGTSVVGMPGAFVATSKDGKRELSDRGLGAVAASLADASVGRWYTTPEAFAALTAEVPHAQGVFRYGDGDSVTLKKNFMQRTDVSAFGEREVKGTSYTRLRAGCLELVAVRTAPAPEAEHEGHGHGGFGAFDPPGPKTRKVWRVKGGAKLTWPSGLAAGIVVGEREFDEAPTPQADRSCFNIATDGEGSGSFPLCVTAAGMTVVEIPVEPKEDPFTASTGLLAEPTEPDPDPAAPTQEEADRMLAGEASIKGPLDEDVIHDKVRGGLAGVRKCYIEALAKDPKTAGTVNIQFVIGPTGKVPVAVVASSTLKNKSVGNCVAKAVKKIKFPRPAGGGNVVVKYPFVFSDG